MLSDVSARSASQDTPQTIIMVSFRFVHQRPPRHQKSPIFSLCDHRTIGFSQKGSLSLANPQSLWPTIPHRRFFRSHNSFLQDRTQWQKDRNTEEKKYWKTLKRTQMASRLIPRNKDELLNISQDRKTKRKKYRKTKRQNDRHIKRWTTMNRTQKTSRRSPIEKGGDGSVSKIFWSFELNDLLIQN